MGEDQEPAQKRRRTAAVEEEVIASPAASSAHPSISFTKSSSFTGRFSVSSCSTTLSTNLSDASSFTRVTESSSSETAVVAETPTSSTDLKSLESIASSFAAQPTGTTVRSNPDRPEYREGQLTGASCSTPDAVSEEESHDRSPKRPKTTGLYASLPLLSSWSIRLLRLLPAPSGSQLTGELFVSKLDETTDFEALSYTWGEPYDGFAMADETIDISGHELEIKANLASALRQLRYEDKPRVIWIDAICIDQLHERERGYQIEIMEDIYSRARCVLVWLGEESEAKDGACVFDFCHVIEQYGLRPSHDAKRAIKAYQTQWPDHKALGRQFAQRNYWRRRWIIQELCHAQDVRILCGTNSAALSVFSACISRIPSSRRAMQDVKELCTTITHLRQALQDWRDSHIRSSQVSTLSDFIWMLQRFHEFDCLDPRDRLFALISLWKGGIPTSTILADYSLTCEQLYVSFSINMINKHSPNPQVIRQLLSIAADQACNKDPSESDASIPTWVADWRLEPAKRIGPHDVFGDICISGNLDAHSTVLNLNTRCYGEIVESEGHYRDWILKTENHLLMPSFHGTMPDEDYVAALANLCPKVQVGDVLTQPYSTYRARHGYVADAALLLRPVAESPNRFRIVGRCPLDLWWHEAQGEARRTEDISTESLEACVE